MDKRVLVAAAFSILILVIWAQLFPPPERSEGPELVEGQLADTSTEPREESPERIADPSERSEDAEPVEAPAEAIQADRVETVQIETDVFQVELTNEGGGALSWKLRQYTTQDGEPLELLPSFAEAAPTALAIQVDDLDLSERLNSALYEVRREKLLEGGAEHVTFVWSDGKGLSAWKGLTFREGSYLVEIEAEVTQHGRRLPTRMTLGPGFGAQEEASSYYYEAWTLDQGGQVRHTQKNKRKGYSADRAGTAGDVYWAGLEDQYFAALFLPRDPGATTRVNLDPIELTRLPLPGSEDKIEQLREIVVSVSVPEQGAELFVGPKKYRMLETLGDEMENVVWFFDLGFLAWISKRIYLGLLWLHDNTIQNYGLAIIMATFILRVLLFPLNQYSMVKMKKTQLQMQRLQPKIKAIKTKFKQKKDADSRNKMNQEMMELYRKEGVNPMGGITGCLPMLGQFPILIGFYGMLTVAVELRGAPFFGWIHDLSRADPYWIMPLLMGVTMFVQQMMAMSKVKDPMQQQQQRFMMIMPVVFTVICLSLPSGLVLYWFVNNVLGIGQQWLVNRHTGKLEAEHAGGPPQGRSPEAKQPKQPKPTKQAKHPQATRKKKVAR